MRLLLCLLKQIDKFKERRRKGAHDKAKCEEDGGSGEGGRTRGGRVPVKTTCDYPPPLHFHSHDKLKMNWVVMLVTCDWEGGVWVRTFLHS